MQKAFAMHCLQAAEQRQQNAPEACAERFALFVIHHHVAGAVGREIAAYGHEFYYRDVLLEQGIEGEVSDAESA